MPPAQRPTLHILAGPNGAGKSTLYQTRLQATANAEFVNPDLLVREALGRHPLSREEAELGQRLANERRDVLMAARRDLVTESTFSHPSKLELIEDAHDLGYRVTIYHVNVRDPDLSIERVAFRVSKGGHPVPEANIRARYDRNQPLIRNAVLMSERGFIFDNSVSGRAPRLLIAFKDGVVIKSFGPRPTWASSLYADDLAVLRR
ncbi:MAG: zeta toxin family protein [Caulobacteraceae bacterium]